MKHLKVLLLKSILLTLVLWLILGFVYEVSSTNIIITSLILTITSFIIGDLYALPKIGNVGASMIDFITAVTGIYIMGTILIDEVIPLASASILAAIGVTLSEILVHWYRKKLFVNKNTDIPGYYDRKLQTEFADETCPEIKADEVKDPQE
ncbi:DUF2512 family protein [Virgibacillus flavescens]|uniref:DUF2512 family protein n=1 Tax=Virgibacillus flavescens TaxID=1611422 RepID=UPI003D338261